MSGGTIEHWIEIPVKVEYSIEKPEPMTWTYPGSPGGISLDDITWPDDEKMRTIIDKHADEIEWACREDAKD